MSGGFLELNGIRVYEVSAHGPELRTGNDAVDLLSAAAEHRSEFIAIPVERLGDDFFELRTKVAGERPEVCDVWQARRHYRRHLPETRGEQVSLCTRSRVQPWSRPVVCGQHRGIGRPARR